MTDTRNKTPTPVGTRPYRRGVCHEANRTQAQWLPALAFPTVVIGLSRHLVAWEWMWVVAVGLFLGAKWLTIWPLLFSKPSVPAKRLLVYCLLWPGMDAVAFCTGRVVVRPGLDEWALAAGKTVFGAALVWIGAPLLGPAHPVVAAWLGMVGLTLVLHFGSFHLLALVWRSRGVDARPIMRTPLLAPTLSAFWGGYWNRAFTDLMHRHCLVPLARALGMTRALLAVFLVSGLLHELVISVPARGGYGLPTLYFAAQGFGVLLERSRAGRRLGLGRGWRGRAVAWVVAAGPVFWLFHPPFIRNVILPMLRAIGAL